MKKYIDLLLFFLIINTNLIYIKSSSFELLSNKKDFSQVIFTSTNELGDPAYSIKNTNKRLLEISHSPSNEKILSMDALNTLTINSNVKVDTNSLDILMQYSNSNIKFENENQWTLLSLDDFEDNNCGWSDDSISKCGNNNNFLGGFCYFSGKIVSKEFKNLPDHKMIKITANFHFLDNWEGENAFMKFNGLTVWKESYNWCDKFIQRTCRKFGISVCGNDYPDRLNVPIEFIKIHNEDSFKLEFGSDLQKSPCDASWGIDNVAVYIK